MTTPPLKPDASMKPATTAAGMRSKLRQAIDQYCLALAQDSCIDAVLATLPVSLAEMADIADGRKRVGDGWLPIEGAPKDGTFILTAQRSGLVLIMQFCADGYWRRSMTSADSWNARWEPTHYMPLPTPPKDAAP